MPITGVSPPDFLRMDVGDAFHATHEFALLMRISVIRANGGRAIGVVSVDFGSLNDYSSACHGCPCFHKAKWMASWTGVSTRKELWIVDSTDHHRRLFSPKVSLRNVVMILRLAGLISVCSLIVFVSGCTPSAEQGSGVPVMTEGLDHDHDHEGHDHPETLAEALEELNELRDTIRDAFAENDSDAAHDPLHEAGHVLEEVSELGGEAELSAEAKATIETNVEALLDAFGEVDKGLHSEDGKEGADYKDVAAKIDAAIDAITKAAGPALEDHDHDGHDDDHDDHDHDDDHDHEDGDHDDEDKKKDADNEEK